MFKTVIFMKDFKVAEISEVTGVQNGELQYNTVFDRKNGIARIRRIG